jgi:hypothetical protein
MNLFVLVRETTLSPSQIYVSNVHRRGEDVKEIASMPESFVGLLI